MVSLSYISVLFLISLQILVSESLEAQYLLRAHGESLRTQDGTFNDTRIPKTLGVLRRRDYDEYDQELGPLGVHVHNETGDLRSILRVLVSPDNGNLDYVAKNVTYSGFWEELKTFPERRPCLFNLYMASAKTWTADLIVQCGTVQPDSEGRRRIDWRRSLAFALFGLIYVGKVQWQIYVTLFSRLFPNACTFANEPFDTKVVDTAGQYDLLKQVLTDNFIINPLLYFPVFYVIKGYIMRMNRNNEEDDEQQAGYLDGYRKTFWYDNLCSALLWLPGDTLIFSAPMFLRMPMDHSLSFLWTMLLSYFRGGTTSQRSHFHQDNLKKLAEANCHPAG